MCNCQACEPKIVKGYRENGTTNFYVNGKLVYSGTIGVDDAILHCKKCGYTVKMKKRHVEPTRAKVSLMKIRGYGQWNR